MIYRNGNIRRVDNGSRLLVVGFGLVLMLYRFVPVYAIEEGGISDTIAVSFPINSAMFESDEPVEVVLKFDITRFMAEKPDEKYLDAVMSFHVSRKDSVTRRLRLRSRGGYRYSTCPFTPIRFNFTRSDINDEEITSIKNMKLVTHCQNEEVYTVYLFKEYLVYRIYNLITDYSFRVRLMRINYIDTGSEKLNFTRWAFIIEPTDMFAKRTGMKEMNTEELSENDIAPGFTERLALFEYMIGNSDWFIQIVHNLKLFYGEKEGGIIPVPYDFDYSGFVNTAYAVPRKELGLENIRDRAYIGPCPESQSLSLALHDFEIRRKEINNLLRSFRYLEYSDRIDVKTYVKSFYSLYKKDEIVDLILKSCKFLTN